MLIAKFELGTIVVTEGVQNRISEADQMLALNRHAYCDWGDVPEDDRTANENGLIYGERLFSIFRNPAGTVFWVITEAERTATTLLLPGEC